MNNIKMMISYFSRASVLGSSGALFSAFTFFFTTTGTNVPPGWEISRDFVPREKFVVDKQPIYRKKGTESAQQLEGHT